MKIYFLLIFSFFTSVSYSQRNEFGIGVGGFNYAGDLMRGYHFDNVKPGILGYYKLNLDNIFSVRASLTGGLIGGSDENPIDPFASNRRASFQTTLVEVAGILEYNFLNYKANHVGVRWSPYFMAGISGFTIFGGEPDRRGNRVVELAIPFGGGFKYQISPNITFNLEIGIRKLFFDQLDGYSDGDITNKNYQYGNKYDQDWYNFVGLSVSYLIWDIPCPYDFY